MTSPVPNQAIVPVPATNVPPSDTPTMQNVTANSITITINHYHSPAPTNDPGAKAEKSSIWRTILDTLPAIVRWLTGQT